jgi:hypothetical protein
LAVAAAARASAGALNLDQYLRVWYAIFIKTSSCMRDLSNIFLIKHI